MRRHLITYTTSPGYFNSTWANFYTNVLDELQIVQRTATAQQLPYYSGIARVLTAYSYGTLTDLFGDIPYKEALNGNSVTNPKYDGQADIYKDLQAQLDTAITELSKPVSANLGATPFTDDVIFKGNIANWLATAYTLKARYAIHLSKANPQEAARQVLAALYNAGVYRGVPSNAADAQVVFGSSATNANPYYQQNTYRPGWIGLGASFVNLLNGNKVTDAPTTPEGQNVDPRRAYFATPSSGTTYRGSAPGVPGAFSRIGSYYGAATAPVILTSYSEAKFLEAEARSILNPADPLAQTALEAAVKASFAKVISGTGDAYATPQKQAEYISAKATLTGNATKDLKPSLRKSTSPSSCSPKYGPITGVPDIQPYRWRPMPHTAPTRLVRYLVASHTRKENNRSIRTHRPTPPISSPNSGGINSRKTVNQHKHHQRNNSCSI